MGSWKTIVHISSQPCAQWLHIGSLKAALVEVFIPWKLESATNSSSHPYSWFLNVYQHTDGEAVHFWMIALLWLAVEWALPVNSSREPHHTKWWFRDAPKPSTTLAEATGSRMKSYLRSDEDEGFFPSTFKELCYDSHDYTYLWGNYYCYIPLLLVINNSSIRNSTSQCKTPNS